MMKKCCEKCIHFRPDWWLERYAAGKCSMRNKTVNRGGFPCRFYDEPKWLERVISYIREKVQR